jgi:DNA mismatch repair ATPase MutS
MPKKVLDRANIILKEYEKGAKTDIGSKVQLTMAFDEPEVITKSIIEEKLSEIDPLNMTPMEALNKLYELKEDLKNNK